MIGKEIHRTFKVCKGEVKEIFKKIRPQAFNGVLESIKDLESAMCVITRYEYGTEDVVFREDENLDKYALTEEYLNNVLKTYREGFIASLVRYCEEVRFSLDYFITDGDYPKALRRSIISYFLMPRQEAEDEEGCSKWGCAILGPRRY